jgi:Icc-related predicted phosphoesterase
MKSLLACGRLDGSLEALESLRELRQRYAFDAVLVGGLWAGPHAVDRRMTVPQKDFYREAFRVLKALAVPVMLVPGEHDVPLADFLRLVVMAEVEDSRLHCVHVTPHRDSELLCAGLGGDLNEVIDTWNDRLRCSRAAAEYWLRQFSRPNVQRTVLLLTTPPAGRLSRVAGTALGGDPALAAEMINSVHPDLAVVAGETEVRGSDRQGTTWVVNPGRLIDGSAALIELGDLGRVAMLDAERRQAAHATA